MKTLLGVVFIVAFSLALASSAWAQSQITTGTIQGEVLDEKGGSVPDAKVEIRNLDTNYTKTETTGSDGRFVFLLLPSGRYTLKVAKTGFATIVQENVNLTVGQSISLPFRMKISAVEQTITVTDTPTVEVAKTESSSTLSQITVGNTPVLGRKFEDLLTLTPGVSIVQGPDGDEITFNGQRGIFNNISLDGGDYNNGFFGEQMGGQRAAIDIPLDAVKEFQVVASGASAEFGRTGGGVVNVITKSGTNELHGSGFGFFRTEGLSSNTSDGKPLKDFSREQFGGSIGGPIIKDKVFFFGAFEQIISNLTRDNLSAPLGPTCSVATPVVGVNDAVIAGSAECQRVALLNFFKTNRNQTEGDPVKHPIRNSAALGRFDWNLTPANQFSASYNFDYSKNTNQTFDVATYGNSANGIEGPSKIHVLNFNLNSSLSATKLNEAHFTYQRELRPRSAAQSTVPADTAMGFATTFRFGAPFFLEPNIDELIWRTQVRDNFSLLRGKHNVKFGGDWIHTLNDQVFRGFFTGRYIFDGVVGFLRYASPAGPGGFGPQVQECSDPTFATVVYVTPPTTCPGGTSFNGGPLLFYLQDGVPTGLVSIPPGASNIKNEDFALFIQDKWQIRPNFTFNYGLRWEAQIFPDPVVAPSQTAYGIFLSNSAFPSDGTLHNQKKEFQPRIGFAWDLFSNHKSVLRASWGIYNARQNMLTQVGSITTNGAQQRTIFSNSTFGGGPIWPNAFPVTPGNVSCPGPPVNPFPCFTGVRVFSKDYANPRIYTTNVAYEQELAPSWAVYGDFTLSKGVHLTRFINVNRSGVFAPQLDEVMTAKSAGQSLYRGFTLGVRKRFSQRFHMEANYTLSKDLDDDSNERDPFTDRSFDPNNLPLDYALSDRDEKHKFNFYTYAELPWGFQADVRMQAHSAQPITPAVRTATNRNTLRKDNGFFSFDWRVQRPIKIGERFQLIPIIEMFNTFNNKNNINPLTTPALFNFDGFLRQGVGDPRQAQFAIKVTF
ncbi:MAG: carboxypeptidase regulatory-like domain-containing protein [Acidobacteria bacterium]|nr:carboxypeptidase regulatory-like domain-containing protein [Acidobacteriota bacterium]